MMSFPAPEVDAEIYSQYTESVNYGERTLVIRIGV